jgi:hypothetical protein
MFENDPHQLRSSIMAYRNLPDVDSIEDCYYLMLNVSLGLQDISRYIRYTIWSLEKTFAVLNFRPTNRSVSRYIRDNYKDATWVQIIRNVSDERNSWKKNHSNINCLLNVLVHFDKYMNLPAIGLVIY